MRSRVRGRGRRNIACQRSGIRPVEQDKFSIRARISYKVLSQKVAERMEDVSEAYSANFDEQHTGIRKDWDSEG